jgi:hypothetical protein
VAIAAEAERLAGELGDRALLGLAMGSHAFFESSLTGELLEERFRRAMALEEDNGSTSAGWSATSDFGQVLLDAQELEEARPIFERLVRRDRADQLSILAEHLDDLALVELHAGNLDLAAELATEAIELAMQTGRENPRWLPNSGSAGSKGCAATSTWRARRVSGRFAWPPAREVSPGHRSRQPRSAGRRDGGDRRGARRLGSHGRGPAVAGAVRRQGGGIAAAVGDRPRRPLRGPHPRRPG